MEPKLPNDYCRCQGEGCDRKEECVRYLAREQIGMWTPMANRLCRVEQGEYDHIIPARFVP